MTEASHNVFVDRRTQDQRKAELATQVLFWYDDPHQGRMRASKHDRNTSRNGRVRTNGVAISTDGLLIVARISCYIRDQFNKKLGRRKVEQQILGRAQACAVLQLDNDMYLPEAAAAAYAEVFPGDDQGHKRAYNAGKIFMSYREEIERRANELDEL
jgi:hypothetical protein